MRAMLLERIQPVTQGSKPLRLADLPTPRPAPNHVLVRVHTCGVCHTELDEIEGRTPPPVLPVVPGHQAVGFVEALGHNVQILGVGDRVGVAWIYSTCGTCEYCTRGQENLCSEYLATGRDVHGGYSEFMTVPAEFAHPIPTCFTDAEAAPLLCAGAIGLRSIRLTGLQDGQSLGLSGFGASAHLVLKLVRASFPSTEVFVFARAETEREFARACGAVWAGDFSQRCPTSLHAVIDTTPVWRPIVAALQNLRPGGRLVINAIRKEDADKDQLLSIEYSEHLWREKEIKSVANVTRADVRDFLALAAEIPIRPEIEEYALEDANRALVDLKTKNIRGAKVLRI